QDRSAYGLLVADRQLFEPEDEVEHGTTNVDFASWLWHALAGMRSSRDAWLCVDSGKEGQGGGARTVEAADDWVRGFLQLQEAMALPGPRFTARPVDLLAAVRFLRQSQARVAPRALRYEFEPDRPVRLVLEPWEKAFVLKGSEHNYQHQRVVRTWGRRRLR